MSDRPRAHPVDLSFAITIAAMLTLGLTRTRDYYFVSDDLLLLQQGASLGSFLESYNGHLSLVPLSLYRGLAEAAGLRFAPFQVVGTLCLLAAPVAYYLTTRHRMGRAPAAVLALALLAAGHLAFIPSELNHHLALVGAIACAWALDRGPRADGWLALALTFSLASAGGGAAVAVACVVHCAAAGASRRRWAATLAPTALWGAWALAESGGVTSTRTEATRRSVWDVGWQVVGRSFEALGLHHLPLGALLLAAFGALGGVLLQLGRGRGANWLAWTSALLAWTLGVAFQRGDVTDPSSFRYQYFTIGMVLLAVVPRRAARPAPHAFGRPWAGLLGAALVLLVGGLRVLSMSGSLDASTETHRRVSVLNHGRVAVLAAEPSGVPDDRRLPFAMGGLTAGEVRALIARYGSPPVDDVDRLLLTSGVATSSPVSRGPARCEPLAEVVHVAGATGPSRLVLWSPDEDITILVRRFDTTWLRLDDLPFAEGRALTLPGLESDVPWRVLAIGACARS